MCPSLKNVHVFGCTAYVLRLPAASKLEARAVEGIFLESIEHVVYRVLVKRFNEVNKNYSIIESRHVTFDKSRFIGAPELYGMMEDEDARDRNFQTQGFKCGHENEELHDSNSESSEFEIDSDSDMSIDVPVSQENLSTSENDIDRNDQGVEEIVSASDSAGSSALQNIENRARHRTSLSNAEQTCSRKLVYCLHCSRTLFSSCYYWTRANC